MFHLEAEHISVSRLGRQVLDGVTLSLRAGEVLCVIGPNGAGKSTLMSALAGLLPVARGKVLLNGEDLARLKRRAVARQLAHVAQLHEGYMGFTVRDVVEGGRYAYVDPLSPLSGEDRTAVDRAVAASRSEALLDRVMDTLSGGERQKAWLAAALAQQTPALLLDEPTNALDPAHQVELIRIMRRFQQNGGTLMVICHDLSLPVVLGGRVVGLKQGRVFFDDDARSLADTARLEALYSTRFVKHLDATGAFASIHADAGGAE